MTRGSYALGLALDSEANLAVGRLGAFVFPPGYYLYVGSARGPGGLPARLGRHRRREKRPHWHVDYLRLRARLVERWTVLSEERLECVWAQALLAMPGACIVAPGFGASDCGCSSHLIHFDRRPMTAQITRVSQESLERGFRVTHHREVEKDAAYWIQILLSGDEEAREEAAAALGRLGDEAVPHLLALLDHDDGDARCWAVWSLAHTGSSEAAAPLVAALDDPDCDMRICAAMALGEMRAVEAVSALVGQLESWNGLLARCAADALEKIGPQAVSALVAALEHPKSQVRVWATRALGRIGAADAVEALCHVYLYDQSYLAQHYAEEALREMGLLETVLFE
jgi:Uri superfamily endonuclease